MIFARLCLILFCLIFLVRVRAQVSCGMGAITCVVMIVILLIVIIIVRITIYVINFVFNSIIMLHQTFF